MDESRKHTPLPWKAEDLDLLGHVCPKLTAGKVQIGLFETGRQVWNIANAKFAEKACNNHYKLRMSIKCLLADLEGARDLAVGYPNCWDLSITEARAALADSE